MLLVPAAYVPRPDGAASVVSSHAVQFLSGTVLRSDFLFWSLLKLWPATLVRSILATRPELLRAAGRDERARVRKLLEMILPISARQRGLLNDGAICSSLPRYELERIVTPTLAISFEDDLFGTFDAARYTAEHVPHARFVGYASGGHVWIGHEREAAAEIAGFLGG